MRIMEHIHIYKFKHIYIFGSIIVITVISIAKKYEIIRYYGCHLHLVFSLKL